MTDSFDAWRFAPDNGANGQTIANLAHGMDLAARKRRTPYILEPTLLDQLANGLNSPVFGLGTSLPDDAWQDAGGDVFYKGSTEPVPIARRSAVLPVSPTATGLTLTMPGALDVLGNALPGPKGSFLRSEFAKPAASLTLRALGKAWPEAVDFLAKTIPTWYDPPVRNPRPFEADYPKGVPDGPLQRTIDGAPLDARYVAGRRDAGATDHALDEDAIREVDAAITGKFPEAVPEALLPRGAAGVYRYDPARPSRPGDIRYLDKLDDASNVDVRRRVLAHETGHLATIVSGQTKVSHQRVQKELGRLYHALNTGEDTARRQSWVSPKAYGYSARDEPLEYMADVFGAYLLNPNTVKEPAPITARELRKASNTGRTPTSCN